MEHIISYIANLSELQYVYESNLWREEPTLAHALRLKCSELLTNLPEDVGSGTEQMFNELILGEDQNWDEEFMLLDDWVQKGGAIPQEKNMDIRNFYDVTEEFYQDFRRYNTTGKAFIANFKNLHQAENLDELLHGLFQDLLDRTKVQKTDLVGMEIRHTQLDAPILIPFRKKDQLPVEHIVRQIESVLQSHQNLDLGEGMECQVTKISPPSGRGWTRKTYTGDLETFVKKHKSVISINADDGLCLPRALVVAQGYADLDPNVPQLLNWKKYNLQKTRAQELMEKAGLLEYKDAWTLKEVEKFQSCLAPDYQIKVFAKTDCNSIRFDGPESPKTLILLLYNDHYFVISKPLAFFNTSYWCKTCNKCYKNKTFHKFCKMKCNRCFFTGLCKDENIQQCGDCNRWFANDDCFKNHKHKSETSAENPAKKRKVLSICESLKRCKQCKVEYYHTTKHDCNTTRCSVCQELVSKSANHQCYIKTYDPIEIQKGHRSTHQTFIFFDFETQQDREIDETQLGCVFLHEVICCVVHKVCEICWKNPEMSFHCSNCGARKHIFLGEHTLQQFVKWLFSEENRGSLAIAHNGRAYDFQFILKQVHECAMKRPKLVQRGLKILSLEVAGVKCVDSLSFLNMPLSSMPKAFDLHELKKGHFPHLFSSLDRMDYIGPLPDAWFYSPATMNEKQKKSFFTWYFENKHKSFDFKNDLVAYCNSDVDILKQACMTFQEAFLAMNKLDPFVNAITIADASMKVYRSLYLPEETIGRIPIGDYRVTQLYSNIAIKWLRWISLQQNIQIRHAKNGKEFTINIEGHPKALRVDGQHDNNIYEFHGCSFHGCPNCYSHHKQNTLLPLIGKTALEAYQNTLDREQAIKSAGFNLVVMWECELKSELKQNKEMQTFFEQQILQEPLKARDAFYGGRTEAIKLYHETNEDEKIKYIDICSLYPWVLKYGRFPVDHPTIITENFEDIKNRTYHGLIKCCVLPPRKLYHPLLPLKLRGKLMFALCKKCAEEEYNGPCNHTKVERMFWGSWITPEIYKAMDLGYKVIEVSEIWHYHKFEQFDPQDPDASGLFTDYIDNFLKMKQEASDWPEWCQTEKDKHNFIENYEIHENISLDPGKIQKNPAVRAIAKLCLNSLFGKFGQKADVSKQTYCNNPKEFFELMSDCTKKVQSIQFINNSQVLVNHKAEDGFEGSLPHTNVTIAAFVTGQARLKLYSYLEALQEQVFYYDTDSVVYLSSPNAPEITTGDYLGEMTNELEVYGKNAYISKWCTAGPKNYAYQVTKENGLKEHCVKIKGFTLDSTTGKRLNLNTLEQKVKAYVGGGQKPVTDVVSWRIDKTVDRHVISRPQKKSYTLVVDKRYCTSDYKTYPFGY